MVLRHRLFSSISSVYLCGRLRFFFFDVSQLQLSASFQMFELLSTFFFIFFSPSGE